MIDWLACNLVKGVSGLLCRLPPAVAVWVGEQVGRLAYWVSPKRAQIGCRNLRAAFDGQLAPAQCRRIIRTCYQQLGAGLLELLRLPAIDRAYVDRYITMEGFDRLDQAVTSRRPLVLLTAHYGNWELSSIVVALLGSPIVALARVQEKFPKLYQLLVSYRESKGCTIIHKGGAMKRLVAALEQGRPIGIVGDQASRQGLCVDFFGRPALFAKGPFELAYRKEAQIIPAFIHRIRGPFHRIIVEPPISLDRRLAEDDAVRSGIKQFAAILSRHIKDDPTQWLWMHKRWKHTPARRALVLSDGKLGHVKQSLAAVAALRTTCPTLSHAVVEVQYRSPCHRALALFWSWWAPAGLGATACLRLTLTPQSAAALLSRYADVVVSCGASTAAANLLWAASQQAKSVVILNPAPLPLRRFHLVIAPRHDGLPRRSNVVQIAGALVAEHDEEAWRQATERLQAHPKFRSAYASPHQHPVVAVFIGGETPHYDLDPGFAETLIGQVKTACEAMDGWMLVTTSRRTSAAVERTLSERLGGDSRCRLLLLATRDPIDGTMEGMLGSADVAVVTGESISMVSEACASGRRVIVVEPPRRQGHRATLTKHQRFLRELAHEGYVQLAALPEVQAAIRRALREREPGKRLDDFANLRHAVKHLLD